LVKFGLLPWSGCVAWLFMPLILWSFYIHVLLGWWGVFGQWS